MHELRAYCAELIRLVESGGIETKRQLNEVKIRLCKKHGIAFMPSNATILSFASRRTDRLLHFLKVKPTRSLSGIAVIAIMPPPHKCPGKCIYCPNSLLPGKETPKSYTGKEPATMRALSAGFDAEKQIRNRLQQLQEAGHGTGKVELIVMGGTFLATSQAFQRNFMLRSINALCNASAKSLPEARKAAESSDTRITGITFETRPDYCGEKEISGMLGFGGTRCELGVQALQPSVLKRIHRGHSIQDTARATQLLKDSAFKVTYHCMPGLPGVSFGEEKKSIKRIFSSREFRPDNLKIYPCLVIEGTELFRQWKQGKFEPMQTEEAIRLLSQAKRLVPRWARIMRIQRDIPSQLISAGVQKSNLRQLVQQEMHRRNWKCNCIRCREAGLLSRQGLDQDIAKSRVFTEKYGASNGKEFFISMEDPKRDCLFGFARLRFPSAPFRKEISESTALLRELRVFGMPLPLHERNASSIQHKGIGKALLRKAEEAASRHGSEKLLVISGLGTKQYYYALGFKPDGLFVSKSL